MGFLKGSILAAAVAFALNANATPVEVKAKVSYDEASQQLVASRQDGSSLTIPATGLAVESFCEYVDLARNHLVFIVGEEGRGQQWQVADRNGLLPKALKVRDMALPPIATHCEVDPVGQRVYVNEEDVGLWSYPADADSELSRIPVAMEKPFGIFQSIAAFAVIGGHVIVADPKSDELVVLENAETGTEKSRIPAPGLDALDVERLNFVTHRNGELTVRAVGDDGERDYVLPWSAALDGRDVKSSVPVVAVMPSAETDSVERMGDAADDPAIWIHLRDRSRSRVLGTDKQGGLQVYDLSGKRLQDLRVGRLNNVDLRDSFAAASNRDTEALHMFRIATDGNVTELAQIPTRHKDIYGLCMAKDSRGRVYVIANQKDGTFMQYLLAADGKSARVVRTFKLNSQPEGCVASSTHLFVGEEAEGVYRLPLDPSAPAKLEPVIRVGDVLHKDVEGLALYGNKYLVVSSQGNDSYVILDQAPPYRVRGVVRVLADARNGIDGASETDGLEVTDANLGGVYSRGMLVVQDGRNRMPEEPQNYKYIPWSSIAEALQLD